MTSRKIVLVALLAACIPALAFASHTPPKPKLTKQEQQSVRAMSNASTWGHPDLYGQFTGMEEYAHGNYKKALKFFKYGARYADKFSQLCIGLMYLHGRGVKRDPAKAWAWLAVSAERGYPKFVATRNRVWKKLDAAQLTQAKADRAKLEAVYGDKVAKPRMRHALELAKTEITGSLTGFNSGVQHLPKSAIDGTGTPTSGCTSKTVEGAPIAGCGGNIYAKWRWDPKLYFKVENARWESNVKVGKLKSVKPSDKGKQHGGKGSASH